VGTAGLVRPETGVTSTIADGARAGLVGCLPRGGVCRPGKPHAGGRSPQTGSPGRVGSGVSVLELCCGVAGPGRMITAESGCHYPGVDQSASALATARQLAGNLPCRFEQAHLPPLPEGRFEVVFLLETMLAFPDKDALGGEVARVLEPGGRFAFTVKEGRPLTQHERTRMPAADTVWPIELAELTGVLRNAGLT